MKTIRLETVQEICKLLEIDPEDTLEIYIGVHEVTVTRRHGFISRKIIADDAEEWE